MSTPKELQEEEYEVLKSIYEGDEKFTEMSSTSFSYKFESDENPTRAFIVEFSCGENYPDEPPKVNMDVFFNAPLNQQTKNNIETFILSQASSLVGSAMIYTLIEALKENVDNLITIDEHVIESNQMDNEYQKPAEIAQNKKIEKKEQLTKAQKRRILNKQEKGEFPRGWNWVDIIQHLSSTSQKNS